MSFKDPYLFNIDMDVHLRDARHAHQLYTCLLYTSDAADEGLGVDLGGRRII